MTKNKVLLTLAKDDDPFDLNENVIFSKFDLFSKRLQKVQLAEVLKIALLKCACWSR